jgi:ABC-2 type transport system ATP-binding protein
VSSHLLSEVEATCDRVAIVNRGRLVSTGTVQDVLGGAADLLVRVADLDGAVSVLVASGVDASRGDDHVRVPAGVEPGRVSRTLGAAGHWVTELRPVQRSLEERFFELTADLPEIDAAELIEEVGA